MCPFWPFFNLKVKGDTSLKFSKRRNCPGEYISTGESTRFWLSWKRLFSWGKKLTGILLMVLSEDCQHCFLILTWKLNCDFFFTHFTHEKTPQKPLFLSNFQCRKWILTTYHVCIFDSNISLGHVTRHEVSSEPKFAIINAFLISLGLGNR